METTIRKGYATFYGDSAFRYGISRSGFFNKRESEELALYGKTFEGLCSGELVPENNEEREFVEAISTDFQTDLYPVKLWKKYLASVEKSHIHHGFSRSESKVLTDVNYETSLA